MLGQEESIDWMVRGGIGGWGVCGVGCGVSGEALGVRV